VPSSAPDGLLDSVLDATASTRPRPAWRVRLTGDLMPDARSGLSRMAPLALATTVLIMGILIGIGLLMSSPNVGPPPAPSPTQASSRPIAEIPYAVSGPMTGPGTTPLAPGTYRMRGPGHSPQGWPDSIIVTVPDGWFGRSVLRGAGLERSEDGRIASLDFGSVGNLHADPCASELGQVLQPPPGPSVDELVVGLQSLPRLEFAGPTDTSLGGWPGKQLQVSVPADCVADSVAMWETPPDAEEVWRANSRPGWHSTLWILDVEGLRFVVMASYEPDAPDDVLRELEQMVDSIQIEP
jgi:hypothetical protein